MLGSVHFNNMNVYPYAKFNCFDEVKGFITCKMKENVHEDITDKNRGHGTLKANNS